MAVIDWLKKMLSPPRYHTVKKGDTLSDISEKYYGDHARYMAIFDSNRDILSDPNKIQPGQRLRIPYL